MSMRFPGVIPSTVSQAIDAARSSPRNRVRQGQLVGLLHFPLHVRVYLHLSSNRGLELQVERSHETLDGT